MAAEADANDERLMRRAIAESRLAVEEDNAMVRYVCLFDSLVLHACFFAKIASLFSSRIFSYLCDSTRSL